MMRITNEVTDRLIEIFLDHEGKKQSLSKESLYKAYFKEAYDESTTTKMFVSRERWRFLRRGMKWLRARSDYYVVCEPVGFQDWEFYLVKNQDEFSLFDDRLESIVKGIRYVQKRGADYIKKRGM